MLKHRLVACLTLKERIIVQSIGFEKYLPIGRPEITIEFLNNWGIDEIVVLDIDATRESRLVDIELVQRISKKCFVPLTVGGGITTVEEMKELIRQGADKICINTSAIQNPPLIREASHVLGSQCVVVSLDVKKNGRGEYEIFTHSGKKATGINPRDFAQKAEALGAGEIFITSITRDGSKQGYDLELIKEISRAVSIPVVACGGVGNPSHFVEAIRESTVSAVAAGNYFHFTEHSPMITKAFISKCPDAKIRFDTYADYRHFSFMNEKMTHRIDKKEDQYLKDTRFKYHPKEVI
ncbi:imidazole glycerol phosphate synthase cyclase subunit [Candidatus Woesearchaeota archaeon]|nr:imidazole glycerol phosphate synthase cyclase subunit [Candidatus Woesearchaeota archaeon]